MAKDSNKNQLSTDKKEKDMLEQIEARNKEIEENKDSLDNKNQEAEANEIKLDEKECDRESLNTAEKLKKDMVEIKIPFDQLNKKDLSVNVFINGYRWSIKRGENVKVPREVGRILEEGGYI